MFMGLREVEFILGFDETISTRVQVDESSTVYEVMSQTGLLPRDGSLRYAIDEKGNSLNHQKIQNAPAIIRMGLLKHIDSIWGEKKERGPFTSSERFTGEQLLIPGIEVGNYCNVFITQRKRKGRSYAYRFRTEGLPYQNGDIVYVRAPQKGSNISLFDPLSGRESIQLPYLHPSLDQIRGFWGCCEIQTIQGKQSAVFRPDLTPVPKNFQSRRKKSKVKLVQCSIKKTSFSNRANTISKGSVLQPVGGFQRALITGPLPKKGTTCEGVLLRFARKNSPALVNRPYYHDGQYLFIKLPETGNTVAVHNIIHPDSPIKMRFIIQQGLSINAGQWVVAKITRDQTNKRLLVVEGTPKDHPSCQI